MASFYQTGFSSELYSHSVGSPSPGVTHSFTPGVREDGGKLCSKTCLKQPLKNRQNKGLRSFLALRRSKVLQNAPLGAFCNTSDLH